MAHHKSALKRIRTSAKRNLRNRHYRSTMRSSIRRVVESETPETGREHFRSACSVLDRLVSKGVIHRNTAARRKSRLYRIVSEIKQD